MNICGEDKESKGLPSMSNDETGRRPTLRCNIKEDNKPREAYAIDNEESQNGNVQGRSRCGSVFDEEFEGEHHIRKPRSRKSSSSYTAPTKASQARKNEKLEIPSYPSNARQRAFSMLGSLRASPTQPSPNTFKNSQGASPISDYLPQSPWEKRDEAHQARQFSPNPVDTRTVGSHNDEYVDEILRGLEQKKQEAEECPGTGENWHFEKEALKKRLKDLEIERRKALNIRGHLQKELAIAKNEVVNLRQRNSDLEGKIKDDAVASLQRDEQGEIELIAEDWKRKYDELSMRTKHLEKIEARNCLEPRSPMEAVEAENKKLRAAITERQKELRRTQNELDEMSEYAQEKDNEVLVNEKKLGTFQAFINDMSEVMTKWAQTSSHESCIELGDMDSLIQGHADDADTKKLLVNTRKLLGNLLHKHEILESRLEDKKYEIENMKKGMEARMGEMEEVVQQSPSLANSFMLTPGLYTCSVPTSGLTSPGFIPSGLTRPAVSLQNDREGFEGLYEEELEKRKAAEKKIQDISAAKKQQLRLQQVRKDLEARLEKVLEENEVLRKDAEEAKVQADLWKDESKQSKLELAKRSMEFQSCIDQNEQEKDQYIKYYHTEIQDESRWEAASLHKKLEDQEQQYKTLKQEFDRSKATNARKQGEIASLERKYMIQSKHIKDVEQAILHNEELPTLPNLDDEDESQYGSELDAFSSASPTTPSIHIEPITDRRPKPRYEHPDAIVKRTAEVEAYRIQLQAKSEKELLGFIFDAPSVTVKKDRTAEDIIEKVRKWSFAGNYPPSKEDWRDIRMRSMWERWQGPKWAAQCKEKRFLDVLRSRGLLEDF